MSNTTLSTTIPTQVKEVLNAYASDSKLPSFVIVTQALAKHLTAETDADLSMYIEASAIRRSTNIEGKTLFKTYIPMELLKRVRAYSNESGVHLTDVTTKAIANYLKADRNG